jgi:ADP-ribose pyrophosphatase
MMASMTNDQHVTLETLAAGRFLRLLRRGHWEYADRVNTTGAVMVVAVTEDRRIILTEQYRVPLSSVAIELPAGLVGDEPDVQHEDLTAAARRELLEETGYEASRLEVLTTGPSSAGMCTEIVTLCLATGLRKSGAGGGIGHERISVHEVPLAEAPQWLAARAATGALVDPKVYAGLYFAERAAAAGEASR